MSTGTAHRTYTIREAAALTGLPASTLRYYEAIGIIAPVRRGESSKHRVYSDEDMDTPTWVACLSATGMSVSDMRRYIRNGEIGPAAAADQVELLLAQQKRLALEAENIAVQQHYVQLKVSFWQAVDAGDAYKAAGEAKELYIVPEAGHVDLYDRTDLIPFTKIESFFGESLGQREEAL